MQWQQIHNVQVLSHSSRDASLVGRCPTFLSTTGYHHCTLHKSKLTLDL
jgi:hypothetical protein